MMAQGQVLLLLPLHLWGPVSLKAVHMRRHSLDCWSENAWDAGKESGHQPPAASTVSNAPPVAVAGVIRTSSSESNRGLAHSSFTTHGHSTHSNSASPTAYTSAYHQPPRSVSPLDQYLSRQEKSDNPVRALSEMSSDDTGSLSTELSTDGAHHGYEIYSKERYEASARRCRSDLHVKFIVLLTKSKKRVEARHFHVSRSSLER